jgi:hypothetical protein
LASLVIGAAITVAVQDLQSNKRHAPMATRVAEPVMQVHAAQKAAPQVLPAGREAASLQQTDSIGQDVHVQTVSATTTAAEPPAASARVLRAAASGPAGKELTPEPASQSAQPAADTPKSNAPAAPFDRDAARAALAKARAQAQACNDGSVEGSTRIGVTFAPSGRVTRAILEGDSRFLGSSVGSCIARHMRAAKVPPFDGGYVTVHATVRLTARDEATSSIQ